MKGDADMNKIPVRVEYKSINKPTIRLPYIKNRHKPGLIAFWGKLGIWCAIIVTLVVIVPIQFLVELCKLENKRRKRGRKF
jgi:hypothetical protein